jgi:hypothetical protein
MALDLLVERGTSLASQRMSWRDMVRPTLSKLDSDAFTRLRVLLMNAMEAEAMRFSHAAAQLHHELRAPLAQLRRIEQHQRTLVAGLLPPDLDPLETTIHLEQLAIELSAALALAEPDEYLASIYRFGLLEDVDHLYRFAALLDRMDGKDANVLLQGHTDIVPGRPACLSHRHPLDELRRPYLADEAFLISKLHAAVVTACKTATHDYYMTVGPGFADPLARQLFAEIASIEEQHVTQYESLVDPRETLLEMWLLHEAAEAYAYWSCAASESDSRLRSLWERLLDQELGHVQFVARLLEERERRDATEVLDGKLRRPIRFESHRELIRDILRHEVALSAVGSDLLERGEESERTQLYRERLNVHGSPSEAVAAGWTWKPGTELANGHGHTRKRRLPS